MNEKLPSTDGDLRISKGNIQSVNEELHTVNSQLQHKVRALEDVANHLNNLLAGSETATLFVDGKLCIKWFSPGTRALFDFVATDIGRPIGHFARKFDDNKMLSDAERVLRELVVVEVEVRAVDGRLFLRRMFPYRTLDGCIAGVVITFFNVTDQKRANDSSLEARVYAEAIVETIRQPLLILDETMHVVSSNRAFQKMFGLSENDAMGKLVFDLATGIWNFPKFHALLDLVVNKNEQFNDVEIEHAFGEIGQLSLLVNGRKLVRGEGRPSLILIAMEDVTERRLNEAAMRASEAQYRVLFNSIDEGFCVLEKIEPTANTPIDFMFIEANPSFQKHSGIGNVVGKTIREMFPAEPEDWYSIHDNVLSSGRPVRHEHDLESTGRILELHEFPLDNAKKTRLAIIFQDITIKKLAAATGLKLTALVESSDDLIASIDLDGNFTSWNSGAERMFGYSAGEILFKSSTILLAENGKSIRAQLFEQFEHSAEIVHVEAERMRKDGSMVWISATVSPLVSSEGEVVGASIIARDITERRRAEAHREILVGELNHRVKNTLAIVSAIASQTLTGAVSVQQASESFSARLMALSRAHDLLMHGNWSGTDLASVVKATIEPHDGGESRFQVGGPHVQMQPALAVTFSLALHELCTNAAKYGALSVQEGSVSIVWSIHGDAGNFTLKMIWTESGGPTVVKPTRKGFGSRLIQKALAMELSGEVTVLYESDGVVCTIDAPLPSGHLKVEPINANWQN